MARKICSCHYTVTPVDPMPETFDDDTLRAWFLKQAEDHSLTLLLAHADDGVIWGEMQEGKLALSGEAFPQVSPPLRAKTLQQARLFGLDAEVLLWRDGDGAWHARAIRDEAVSDEVACDKADTIDTQWYFDEPQIQWGDHILDVVDGFTLVADGQRGMQHAVPLAGIQGCFDEPQGNAPGACRPLRLGVRHYLEQQKDDGALVIVQSRLTGLWSVSPQEV